jgi:hypothetical protein
VALANIPLLTMSGTMNLELQRMGAGGEPDDRDSGRRRDVKLRRRTR